MLPVIVLRKYIIDYAMFYYAFNVEHFDWQASSEFPSKLSLEIIEKSKRFSFVSEF